VVRLDEIKLEMRILERIRVTPMVEKMVENKFRGFKHVERRDLDFVVRRIDQ
jgi:hypothetical protein